MKVSMWPSDESDGCTAESGKSVICCHPVLATGVGERKAKKRPTAIAAINRTASEAYNDQCLDVAAGSETGIASVTVRAEICPDSESLFRRLRSVLISAADW